MPDATASVSANREKSLVALLSVLAAVALTIMKLVTGLLSGSLGLLSEAVHSGLDLVAALITLFAVRASARPADREHTFGHGKIENLSALGETALLLVTCIWIIQEGVQRLLFKSTHVDATVWAFLAVAVSIVIDISRSRALGRVARRHRSQALEADALHFSTDIWSSAVVLLGLVLVRVADKTGLTWLAHADAVAALGVAAIVIRVSLRLGRKAAADLIDTVPAALGDEILQAVRVDGVLDVRQVRLRRSGPDLFVDAALVADRGASFADVHKIALKAEAAVKSLHPFADVVIKIDPAASAHEGIVGAIRWVADYHGFRVHDVRAHRGPGQFAAELHLELDDSFDLDQADSRAKILERVLTDEIPGLDRVIIHLEPVAEFAAAIPAPPAEEEPIDEALEVICRELEIVTRPREVMVHRLDERLFASFRWSMEEGTTLVAANRLSEEIARRMCARISQLERVVIQVEPPVRLGPADHEVEVDPDRMPSLSSGCALAAATSI